MIGYKKYIDEISNTYIQNLQCLSDDETQHFLSRLKLVQSNNFLDENIKSSINNLIDILWTYVNYYKNDDIESIIKIIDDKKSNINYDADNNNWQNSARINYKFLGFSLIIELFNIIDRLNLITLIDHKKLELITTLIEENYEYHISEIYNQSSLIENFPVRCINTFFYTNNLYITWNKLDENKFIKFIRTNIDSISFQNKISMLNHLIIGKSNFYENKLNDINYEWIFEYFKNCHDTIFKECPVDQIIEIGVCYLIFNKFDYYDKFKVFTINQLLKSKEGFILSPFMAPNETFKIKLKRSEHTNALAILLLSDIKILKNEILPIKGQFKTFKEFIKLKGLNGKEFDPLQIKYFRNSNSIFLTFDTCPTNEVDYDVINFLIDNNIPATIFLNISWYMKNKSKDLSFLKNKLFTIGGHGFEHIRPLNQNYIEQYNDIKKCKEFIKNELGIDIKYYRTPYGKPTEDTFTILSRLNLTYISWSYNVLDKKEESRNHLIII